jgi:hypothetical protein
MTHVANQLLDYTSNALVAYGTHNASGGAQQTGWVGQGDGLLAANQAHWRQAA